MPMTDRVPRGALRAALRAPVWLYRWHLGWLLGHRFLLLATRGRRSGLRRENVLEVVHFDRSAGEVVVVSAWGERSDWFRNLGAAPALELRIGRRRRAAPPWRPLSETECRTRLMDYRAAHPRTWSRLAEIMGLPADPAVADLSSIRALAFQLRSPEPGRAPLPSGQTGPPGDSP